MKGTEKRKEEATVAGEEKDKEGGQEWMRLRGLCSKENVDEGDIKVSWKVTENRGHEIRLMYCDDQRSARGASRVSGVRTSVGATTADDSLFNGTSPPESFTPAMGQNRLTIDFVTSIAVADKRRGFK
ncbi:hypothetical protein C0Q70_03231 [Pomacea canaliculata]|uniref:Uncharacterized protein n=1 Tax=Pomacea canaliculata TaxID=400727 RepID=A0A2T7PS47_POMCA|nr:hypothetical protein C0Q70_03231 [Pomacea canaliculata]